MKKKDSRKLNRKQKQYLIFPLTRCIMSVSNLKTSDRVGRLSRKKIIKMTLKTHRATRGGHISEKSKQLSADNNSQNAL